MTTPKESKVGKLAEIYINDFSRVGQKFTESDKKRISDFKAGFCAALNLPEVKAMKEALEFYANKESWEDGEDLVYLYNIIDSTDLSIPFGYCDKRGGKRARQALADLEKVMNGN